MSYPQQGPALISQPYQCPPGQPPFVPNNIPQVLGLDLNILPWICSEAINLIALNTQRSPAHVLMYNAFAQNNYANQNFVELVKTAYMYVAIGLNRGLFQNPQSAIKPAVDKVVAMNMALMINNDPQVRQVAHPQAVSQAQAIMPEIQQMQMEMNQVMQQQYQAPYGQQHYGQQMYNQQPYGQPAYQQAYNQGYQNYGQMSAVQVPATMYHNQAQAYQAPNAATKTVGADPGKYASKPQPQVQESNVNRQQHTIHPFTGQRFNAAPANAVPTPNPTPKPVEVTDKPIFKEEKDLQSYLVKPPESVMMDCYSSIETIIQEASVLHQHAKTKNLGSYVSFIKAPIVTNRDHGALFKKLSEAENFKQIKDTLQDAMYKARSNDDRASLEVCQQVDKYLATQLCRVMKNRMDPSPYLESFSNDLDDMMNFMKENQHNPVFKSFLNFQQEFIEAYLLPMGGEEIELKEAEEGDGKEEKVSKYYTGGLCRRIQVLIIPELDKALGATIHYNETEIMKGKYMKNLVHKCFEQAKQAMEPLSELYLVTLDSVVYRFDEMLNDYKDFNVYTVTKLTA